jgi:hypothetical protein
MWMLVLRALQELTLEANYNSSSYSRVMLPALKGFWEET